MLYKPEKAKWNQFRRNIPYPIMSIFEIVMMVCFGASWPFSVAKTYKFKTSGTKSYFFLWLVIIGYLSGIVHKYLYSWDWVVSLYALNALMVALDLFLCYYYDWHKAQKDNLPTKTNPPLQ